nr:hypothetical protein [Bacillus velezensis]
MKKTAAFLVLILLAGALSACQSESGGRVSRRKDRSAAECIV